VEEANAVKGNAVLMVTLITYEGKERPLLRGYVVHDGKSTELLKAGFTGSQGDDKSDTTKAFGKFVEKTFYLLPISLANTGSELFVELQNGVGSVSVGPLMDAPQKIAGVKDDGSTEIDRMKIKLLAAKGFPSVAVDPMRVRVSQGVLEGLRLKAPKPRYPVDAREARVQGSVVLHVVVGKDGHVRDISLVSGHPMLVPAAVDAVRQWEYKPYLLNGEPVQVETQITINFMMGG
jgi:TonB family protein